MSIARGVSADGSVVAGVSNAGGLDRPFRWTAGGGLVNLGKLAGGNGHARALGISGNGSVIVGESGSTFAGIGSLEAFRWSQADGMVGLGDLPGGTNSSHAYAASLDGSVIVGDGSIAGGASRAFRWTASGGMADLGALGGYVSSGAFGVALDGNVVVGANVSSTGTQQAFRWTQATGMVGLGDLPGGTFFSQARGVSADGNRIVGISAGANGSLGDAFIWDPVNGIRDLQDVLPTEFGITVPAGWLLRSATAISADGRYIVGYGKNPDDQVEAWLVDLGANVPEPSGLLLIAAGCAIWACRSRRWQQRRDSGGSYVAAIACFLAISRFSPWTSWPQAAAMSAPSE
jgi:probable HAF family extracellular repeat protein